VKKCPALPLRDRQRAILQFHELPDFAADATALAPSAPGQPPMNVPFSASPGMSALETLAEVSRQHLDLSGKRPVAKGRSRSPQPPPNTNLHNGGMLDVTEFIVQDDRPEGSELSAAPERSGMTAQSHFQSYHQYGCDMIREMPSILFLIG